MNFNRPEYSSRICYNIGRNGSPPGIVGDPEKESNQTTVTLNCHCTFNNRSQPPDTASSVVTSRDCRYHAKTRYSRTQSETGGVQGIVYSQITDSPRSEWIAVHISEDVPGFWRHTEGRGRKCSISAEHIVWAMKMIKLQSSGGKPFWDRQTFWYALANKCWLQDSKAFLDSLEPVTSEKAYPIWIFS